MMKSTGLVREMDKQGHVAIPAELRKAMKIDDSTPMEIMVHGDIIVLRRHDNKCRFCQSTYDVKRYHGVNVCGGCALEMRGRVS